jgi:uncharacterized membrane protein
METWMLYGLLAALFLAASGIVMKLASGPGHYNMEAHTGALFVLVGIAVVFIPYYLVGNNFQLAPQAQQAAIGLALVSGILWGVASIFLYKGFNIGADASKIIPLMNTSALFAVAIGIVMLHEMPSHGEIWRAVVGACMVVLGASLLG